MPVEKRRRRKSTPAPASEDHNAARRELYHTDPVYRAKVRRGSLQHYRKSHPKKPSDLLNGLLETGVEKEVTLPTGQLRVMEVYSVPESAKALGKNVLTFRRWIKEELIPTPILKDTSFQYDHFSAKELKAIAKALAEHERVYDYLRKNHSVTINKIWQQVEHIRKKLLD